MEVIRDAAYLMGWVGLFLIPVVAVLWGVHVAVGVASGMLWALANMLVLAKLIKGSLSAPGLSRWRRAVLWVVKVPLLYLVGAFLLLSPWSSPLGFLFGFSLWFLMLVIGALRKSTV